MHGIIWSKDERNAIGGNLKINREINNTMHSHSLTTGPLPLAGPSPWRLLGKFRGINKKVWGAYILYAIKLVRAAMRRTLLATRSVPAARPSRTCTFDNCPPHPLADSNVRG